MDVDFLCMLRQYFLKCVLRKVGSLIKLFWEMYIISFLGNSQCISTLKDLRGSTVQKLVFM